MATTIRDEDCNTFDCDDCGAVDIHPFYTRDDLFICEACIIIRENKERLPNTPRIDRTPARCWRYVHVNGVVLLETTKAELMKRVFELLYTP